jgi:hypothetical protein
VCFLNYLSRKILKTHRFEQKLQYINFSKKEAILIPEDRTHIIILDMYLGMQQFVLYDLNASIFVDSIRNTVILVRKPFKDGRNIDLIECSRLSTETKTYKIVKNPTPSILYLCSEYGLAALWLDNGVLHVYKMSNNSLVVSQKIGEEGSILHALRFIEKDLILLILDNSKILILRIEDNSQVPSVYLNFRLASTILSEAAYFIEKRGLLIIVNHQQYLEAYKVFPESNTAWLLAKDLFSHWYPLDKRYKLTSYQLNQSKQYLHFHSDSLEKRATLIDVDELFNGKLVETIIGPFETGGRLAILSKHLLTFSSFKFCKILGMRSHSTEISLLKTISSGILL